MDMETTINESDETMMETLDEEEAPQPHSSRRAGGGRPQKKKAKTTEEEVQPEVDLDVEADTTTQSSEDDEEYTVLGKGKRKNPEKIPRLAGPVRRQIRSKGSVIGAPSEDSCSGIVRSLKMYNFMCHDGFFQEWHHNLNFVTGENGSGKSALLTGLLIGLGAKATLTSRTKSLQSLIQKGKDSARTEIVLVNRGALPKEKYGINVGIERTISKTGQSTYRLKTFDKFRKMKKNELDYILLSFNIQLDNPVAILNQEVAKNFLRTKDPKDKYQLFYQGTLLSKLFALLADSKRDIDISQKNLDYHKSTFVALRSEVHALAAKLSELDNLKNIKLQLSTVRLEFYWARVNDAEKELEDLKQKVAKHDHSIGKVFEMLNNSKEEQRTLKEEIEPGHQRITEIREKIQDKEKSMQTTRAELTAAQKKVQQFNAKIKANAVSKKRKERMLNDVKSTLAGLQASAVADKDKVIREYEDRKEKLAAEKATAQAEFVTLKRDLDQFTNARSRACDETEQIREEHRQLTRNKEGKRRQLETLQQAGGNNKFAVFGKNMEFLMQKINANKQKFQKPPRGPIGAFLTVKDTRFSAIVEHVLRQSNFLTTFMVDNNEDFMLLKDLIKESYQNRSDYNRHSMSGPQQIPSIKVNTFSNTVYPMEKTASRVPGIAGNLLDLLEVEGNDPVIVNGLVDYVDAERILMFQTNEAAAQILKDQNKFNRTTKTAYTLEFYRFHPSPRYACEALNLNNARTRLLKSSTKSQIAGLQLEINDLEDKINELRPQLDQKRQAETEMTRKCDSLRHQMEQKRSLVSQIERSYVHNESTKYKEPDVASHEEELREIEADMQKIQTENAEAEESINEVTITIEALTKQKEELNFELNKLHKSIENDASDRQLKINKINSLDILLQRLTDKHRNLEKAKEPATEKLLKCEQELEETVRQAQAIGDRIETDRSSDDVKREIDVIKVRIGALENHIGDVTKLRQEHSKKKKDLEAKLKEYRPLYKCFIVLKDLVQSQLTYLFTKRLSITNGLTLMFQSLVEQRGYKGQLMVDHEKQELHFFICPDKSATHRTKEAIGDNDKHTKKTLVEYSLGLSGGERSFSTICFIISLWQVMECPFYMLDEFDVFMDAFNRKASQQALIAHAKQFRKHQFFLFSPLDLVEIPTENEATVIRLKPARSGNDDVDFVLDNNDPTIDENVDPSRNETPIPSTSKRAAVGRRSAAMLETNRQAAKILKR